MRLKDELQLTLDDVLFDLGIHSHWKRRRDSIGTEYVVYQIISTPNREFANNMPIRREENVDINYYAESKSFNYDRIELIKDAMFQKGWVLSNGEQDIETLERTLEDGINMEFTREVTM
ncbi:hypothetical protein RBG61_01970 [Paludicola sp. MB14-C6]|uniref:hypothetical protein n=1 Tax=Paludihabitans sp. MB14-C6 TaxID=3070656 RepID=UPI0027DBB9A6|nr:hypothetical protein [Paludicola sp. MB14-C6]WMJ23458.1 hypothetical protein RBG61_01970 [Paludicola sp. MB14-C6]